MNILQRKKRMDSPPPFDVSKLEQEIEAQMGESKYFPTLPRSMSPLPPPPEPVSAEELGRITAEAVKAAHESAVKSLEDLCGEIETRVSAIEQLKADSLKQIAECRELAEQYRDAGKTMSLKVESAAADLSEARELIEGIRKKIGK